MDKMELYDNYCPKCKDGTLHRISKISRLKGVKLCCVICGTETKYNHLDNVVRRNFKNGKRTRKNNDDFRGDVS